MSLAGFPGRMDMESGLREWSQTENAVLLDVRAPGEYHQGHLPGSVNLPLALLDSADEIIPEPDTPVFVYCQSGGRSRRAAAMLAEMGYACVKDLGGLDDYPGKVEQ
jgi:rhodanese-related sulfurtransferase